MIKKLASHLGAYKSAAIINRDQPKINARRNTKGVTEQSVKTTRLGNQHAYTGQEAKVTVKMTENNMT